MKRYGHKNAFQLLLVSVSFHGPTRAAGNPPRPLAPADGASNLQTQAEHPFNQRLLSFGARPLARGRGPLPPRGAARERLAPPSVTSLIPASRPFKRHVPYPSVTSLITASRPLSARPCPPTPPTSPARRSQRPVSTVIASPRQPAADIRRRADPRRSLQTPGLFLAQGMATVAPIAGVTTTAPMAGISAVAGRSNIRRRADPRADP